MKRAARKSKKAEDWKPAAVSLLLLLGVTFIFYYGAFSSMKLYIDDADPYSYAAVILPMFIITLAFFYRKDLKVDWNKKKFLLAIPFFAVSAMLLYEAGAFPKYALTLLSLPFFVAGCMLLFFSIYTMKKLLFLILYLFLLWTPLFQPLVSTQAGITDITTDVVQLPLNLLGLPIEREGNAFYSGSKISLEVVPQCVPLSAIIALFCFLLPFAYVAKGEIKNRVAWLAAWVIGCWVLDVLRITAVLLIWYYSGLSNALQVFHAIGGNIIFDLALVAALLSFKLFRLDFNLNL
ncbi:exosortase/archaeosortase family protein [Candidatus Micrarchaeota archaeon]|nr:exosortase/archaeosortase family protein [Candidatus Micrarchaeota archaeon]